MAIKILIAEDDEAIREELVECLTDDGYECVEAANGEEALSQVMDHDFAIILMDVQMPGMDGFEAAELIRGVAKSENVPIIFVTALSKEGEYVFKGYEMGAVDFLFKPLDPYILKSKVNVFLKLNEQRSALEEEVAQRKVIEKELERAKKESDSANQSKSDFLANMSHEIRTPMNAIIGMCSLALKTELTPKQNNYISKAHSSGKALLGIINDILDFSKIEAGMLDMEQTQFRLDKVLDDLCAIITFKAQEKGLEIIFAVDRDVPLSLIGDPLRLGQILTNLCDNAIKFTEAGEVMVSIKALETKPEKTKLQFSIKDTGVGLTKDQIKKLFKAFSQTDASTTRKYGGTGLGLTISKRLVELMEGEIWVESEPGNGTDFIFTSIFGSDKHSNAEKEIITLPEDIKGKKVLVVDDNESSRLILEEALLSFSLDVYMADNGSSAISMVEAEDIDHPYDLIFMDWQMPEMNGIRASEIIKKHPKLNSIPKIIMMTAYGYEELVRQANDAQLDGFLIKPINLSTLLHSIMEAFGGKVIKKIHETEYKLAQIEKGLEKIRGAKILLAEDNEINREIAIELLECVGLEVVVAVNGEEAIQQATNSNFDCILMDLQMPKIDGLAATRALREIENLSDLPIIAMTANAMLGDREKCIEAGMNDHVSKPVDTIDLYSALLKWVSLPDNANRPIIRQENTNEARENIEIELPHVMAGLNIQEGLKRTNKKKNLYLKLLRKFENGYVQANEKILEAWNKGNMEELEQLAHSIKGAAGNIGAKSLADAAQAIEDAAINQSGKEKDLLINHFDQQLKEVMKSLKELNISEDEITLDIDFSVINIPEELFANLNESIKLGMYDDLQDDIDELADIDSNCQQLAEHLKNLATERKTEDILNILNTVGLSKQK
jgi:two-component system, sensor histidine kinase and response regulator